MWQGEGLPDVAGPTALLLRSADGALLKAEAVPAFNNAELPGGLVCIKGHLLCLILYLCMCNTSNTELDATNCDHSVCHCDAPTTLCAPYFLI